MDTGDYQYDLDNPLVYKNEMGRYKTERQLSFIKGFLHRDRMRVLDIGGGGGRIAIPIANLGHRTTIIDVSQHALNLLRQRAPAKIEAVHADIMSFESDEPFDVAMAVDTIKYVSSAPLVEVFKMVNSLLTMDGIVIIAEINKNSWRNHVSEWLGRRRNYRYNIDSAQGYKKALTAAGFEVVAVKGFVWMPLGFNSRSSLVKVFQFFEDVLHLGSWTAQSPWLLIAAKKIAACRQSGTL